jgi:hypothetical protein
MDRSAISKFLRDVIDRFACMLPRGEDRGMAKKPPPGYDAGEARTLEHLKQLFSRAKFDIQRELDIGRSYPDMAVGREDLGRYRQFAIAVALVKDARSLHAKLDQMNKYARGNSDTYDEYWLVSNLSLPSARSQKFHRGVRVFTIKEVERMLDKASPKRAPRPKAGKAQTKIGKAIEADEKAINLAISGLILQIDDKLDKMRDERPNSDEAKARAAEEISELEKMKAELERIRELVAAFAKGKAPEKEVVKSVKTFRDDLQGWWDKSHDSLLTTTAKSALFVSSAGVLAMMDANTPAALAVAGAIIGGKVMKKIKKLGKKALDAIL